MAIVLLTEDHSFQCSSVGSGLAVLAIADFDFWPCFAQKYVLFLTAPLPQMMVQSAATPQAFWSRCLVRKVC